MGSFGQWFLSREKKHPARLTWVCGTEPVLREEVVDWITAHCGAATVHRAGDGGVWDALRHGALGDGTSLVVIRAAELITDWTNLPGLLRTLRLGRAGDRYVVFVAEQTDTWQRDATGNLLLDEKGKKQHLAHLEKIQKSTLCDVIVCKTLNATAPTNQWGHPIRFSDAVLWLQSMGPIGEKEANYLIAETGGDLFRMRNAMRKIAAFEQAPTIGVIEALTVGSRNKAHLSFTEHLIAGEKRAALELASGWATPDLAVALRRLDRALDALGVLYLARRNHRTRAGALAGVASLDAHERSRLSSWDVERFWAEAVHYDARRRAHCRSVLATVDSVLAHWPEHTTPVGLIEALIASW